MPKYVHTPAVDLGFDSLPCSSAQSSLVGQWGNGFLTATRQPALLIRRRVSMSRSSGGRLLKQTLPVALHEPYPLIPSFSPSGGEGARRAVEGVSDRFMAPTHVQSLEVLAAHEPRCQI